jgi:Collagen triple helix repeat (20 copies)
MKRFARHINPATVIALVALVFAASGGAFAATGGGVRGVAGVAKVKKKAPVGKPGPRGPQGPAGAAGPAGAQGPAGAAGARGENGAAGATGPQGSQGPQGPQGEPGPTGQEGSPWTAGGTLPSGKTETGMWTFGQATVDEEERDELVPISFSIPLHGEESVTGAPVIGGTSVHFFERGKTAQAGEGCGTGSAVKPEAEPGNLCVYTSESSGLPALEFLDITSAALPRQQGASATGATLTIKVPSEGRGDYIVGTWAVTAK